MAEAQHSAKACSVCGETKPRDAFRKKGAQCKPCLSARQVVANRRRILVLRETPEGRDRIRRNKRNYEARLVARGLTVNGTPRKPKPVRAAPQTKAPKVRKPWNDPSLTKAEQWKMRYRMDPEFQAREYLKALKRKRARRKLIAESGLPQWRVSLLRIQSHTCAYCGDHMPEVTDRVVDHVAPLSKGGAHAWDNLAVVCKLCNARKFNKAPTARQRAQAARQRLAYSNQLPLIAC